MTAVKDGFFSVGERIRIYMYAGTNFERILGCAPVKLHVPVTVGLYEFV